MASSPKGSMGIGAAAPAAGQRTAWPGKRASAASGPRLRAVEPGKRSRTQAMVRPVRKPPAS